MPKLIVDRASIATISPSDIDEFYSKRREALKKNTPRIVFVPGILGSKIDECQSDGTQCKPVWGTLAAIAAKDVDLSVRPNKTYRTDIVEDIFFKNIYGDVLEFLRGKASGVTVDSIDDPLVNVFSYDWRKSNAENATLLSKKICDVRKQAPNSPIAIIAHSMGGLITKIWAKRYSEIACQESTKPEVSRVVFVASPHLGSPKTIKALATGYNIFLTK